MCFVFFFFQAEDGIRDLVRSRGLGDVYKRQHLDAPAVGPGTLEWRGASATDLATGHERPGRSSSCLLYTSDAADERSSVDLGGRRIIKKKKQEKVGKGGVRQEKHTVKLMQRAT